METANDREFIFTIKVFQVLMDGVCEDRVQAATGYLPAFNSGSEQQGPKCQPAVAGRRESSRLVYVPALNVHAFLRIIKLIGGGGEEARKKKKTMQHRLRSLNNPNGPSEYWS